MKYNFTFTKEDYTNFRFENDIYLREGKQKVTLYSTAFLLGYFLISLIIVISTEYNLFKHLWWIVLTLFVIITILWLQFALKRSIIGMMNTVKTYEPEKTEIEIFEDKIVERTTSDDVFEFPFESVLRVFKAIDYIGFGSKHYTLIIPTRVFDNTQEVLDYILPKLNKDIEIIER